MNSIKIISHLKKVKMYHTKQHMKITQISHIKIHKYLLNTIHVKLTKSIHLKIFQNIHNLKLKHHSFIIQINHQMKFI
jgi:hypothetical protein